MNKQTARFILSDPETMAKAQLFTAVKAIGNNDSQGLGVGIIHMPAMMTGKNNAQIIAIAAAAAEVITAAVDLTIHIDGSLNASTWVTDVLTRKISVPVGKYKVDELIAQLSLPENFEFKFVRLQAVVSNATNWNGATLDVGAAFA